ncbi:MAG: ABC transporter permease [Oscillospiraceae bacterium]|jgi:ABC-type antimicrobial peptide transport system permease subunit|nr:ABC transporter permease [Oscillospiraceae bacterium]
MMRISDVVVFCLGNLFRSKLRTFLTVCGIMLGTGSIVLTLAFSYTTAKNIEETAKKGGDLTKIQVQRAKYNPNKGRSKDGKKAMSGAPSESNNDLDFGQELVDKLSKIPGVDFVFPWICMYGYGEYCVNAGKDYMWRDARICGLDFNKPENLKEMGYTLLPGGEWKTNPPNAKTKNIVAGALTAYEASNVRAHNYEEMQRNPWEAYQNTTNDVKPFFDMKKAKLQLTVLNENGHKQLARWYTDWYQKWGEGSDDDNGSQGEESSSTTIDSFSGDKFNLKVTGIVTVNGFDPANRKWKIIKELYDLGKWEEAERLGWLYADLGTVKELKGLLEKSAVATNGETRKKEKFAYDEIAVIAKSWDDVTSVVNVIQDQLNYKTASKRGEIEEQKKQSDGLRVMLFLLGVMTLVVSALGIANVMFMSVTERTREIGIMKVLGCGINTIRTIFLAEAGIVGFLGGTAGVGGSYALAKGLSKLMKYATTPEFMEKAANNIRLAKISETVNHFSVMFSLQEGQDVIIIPSYLVVGGILFGIIVGLVSGFAPANRAVKISALSAIKTE